MADQAQAAAQHWDAAYARGDDTRSWFEKNPRMSLRMLDSAAVSAVDALIDVGGGASFLAQALLDRGFRDVTVLDVSAPGMQRWRLLSQDREEHITPAGTAQPFTWIALRRES